MKWLKKIVVIVMLIYVILFIAKISIQVDVDENSLPENVYEEQADLLSLVNDRLFDLFMSSVTNEYTVVEEVVNLIILDSIRDNINSEYDPLSDCETIECNYIIYEDNYYVNYIWAELNSDNQLIIHVSVGSEVLIGVNTVFDFYYDIDINYLGFGIELTLVSYNMGDFDLSMGILDTIFSNLDTDQIESSVSKGELDLENYSYKLSFTLLP